MRISELFRLVWLNINQNKFKSVMTSIGIVVGAATIVMVIGIGRGGQMDIADQFAELNAGAIGVSYEYEGEDTESGGFSFGGMMNTFFGGMMGGGPGGGFGDNSQSSGAGNGSQGSSGGPQMPGGGDSQRSDGSDSDGNMQRPDGSDSDGNMQRPDGGDSDGEMQRPDGSDSDGEMQRPDGSDSDGEMPGSGEGEDGQKPDENTEDDAAEDVDTESETSMVDDRLNQEQIILSTSDVEDIETYVSGIIGATISYSTRSSVEGGNLTSAQNYTVAGVQENFAELGKLSLAEGYFLDDTDNDAKSRVCVIGSSVAKEVFGSAADAVNSTIYMDDRSYTVIGVLETSSSVVSGISPDTSVFVPYQTGIKYIAGEDIDPTVTVIAEDVNTLQTVISNVKTVLEENYPNASFTFEDSGSKMKAAESSNRTLTMLLSAMAAIVFLVGGIGIMNIMLVSVTERTKEIGIRMAIGARVSDIRWQFLIESFLLSMIGGLIGVVIGVLGSYLITVFAPSMTISISLFSIILALGFSGIVGVGFGYYPAYKASLLNPIDALRYE